MTGCGRAALGCGPLADEPERGNRLGLALQRESIHGLELEAVAVSR